MSWHLDGSPQPVNPDWYRQREHFRLVCGCGHNALLPIGELAARHGINLDTRLWRIIQRLRCSRCDAAPSQIDVVSRRV